MGYSQSEFFIGRNLAKFRPEKYDFVLYKEFFIENMAQIRQISNKNSSKSADFFDNFYKLPKIRKIST
jgi:hypothetical protein